jgi:hypothetical protein
MRALEARAARRVSSSLTRRTNLPQILPRGTKFMETETYQLYVASRRCGG